MGTYNNSEIGNINISGTAIDKYLSGKAVDKSVSLDAHLSALQVLPQLIEESIVGEVHEDKKGDTNLKDIVRLYGAVNIDGELSRVKITVKRYADSNVQNKAYSYEVTEIEPLEGTLETAHTQGADSVPSSNGSISAANLLNGTESTKEKGGKLLNVSKIVDENGEPMVVYHDTNSTIYRNVETGEIWDELDWRAKQEWDERDDWEEYWQEEDFYTFDNKHYGRRSVEMPAFFFTPNYDEYHEYGDRQRSESDEVTNKTEIKKTRCQE